MNRIKINDFYTELFDENYHDEEITDIENNLSNIKEFYLSTEISKLKTKYFIMKLIMILLEVIDVLVIGSIFFMDNITDLLIIVFILNIIVGIVFIITPDFKIELEEKENEIKRVIV